jgi:Methyltransferase domain
MRRFARGRLANNLRRLSEILGTVEAGTDPTPEHKPDKISEAIDILIGVPPIDIQRRGYHFQVRDYYSPLNDLDFLTANPDLWKDRPLPAGIRWDLDRQIGLLRRIAAYVQELQDVPFERSADGLETYYWNNDFWRGMDAFVHYALLRHLKPARVVEIGCGWSSLLLKRALFLTESQNGTRTSVHQIDPYPRPEIMAALPSHWRQEETTLQRTTLASVENLQKGDVLFYDGSHVARVASDVNWFFFEVLPRVAQGVVIHLHDIFWPADYPETWIFERGQTWNEQYVLQAFLMYNHEFEILLANAALAKHYGAELQGMFHGIGDDLFGGSSIWFTRATR